MWLTCSLNGVGEDVVGLADVFGSEWVCWAQPTHIFHTVRETWVPR